MQNVRESGFGNVRALDDRQLTEAQKDELTSDPPLGTKEGGDIRLDDNAAENLTSRADDLAERKSPVKRVLHVNFASEGGKSANVAAAASSGSDVGDDHADVDADVDGGGEATCSDAPDKGKKVHANHRGKGRKMVHDACTECLNAGNLDALKELKRNHKGTRGKGKVRRTPFFGPPASPFS